jgi:hypothetical protein
MLSGHSRKLLVLDSKDRCDHGERNAQQHKRNNAPVSKIHLFSFRTSDEQRYRFALRGGRNSESMQRKLGIEDYCTRFRICNSPWAQ